MKLGVYIWCMGSRREGMRMNDRQARRTKAYRVTYAPVSAIKWTVGKQ